jgi:hypothetical protein
LLPAARDEASIEHRRKQHNQEEETMAKEATDRERIAALEAQNQQLHSEIAQLKAGRPEPRQPAPLAEEGVTVSHPRIYPIEMPTTEQFEKLLNIVARVYPKSVPAYRVHDEYFRGFVGSFERITSLRRSSSLNITQGVQYWADEAYSWLRERGTPAETTNGSYFAAVAASGDVDFSLANRDQGILPYYGLTFDTEARKISPGAWQRVLSDCRPRAPVAAPAPLPQNQRTAQVRIYG